MRLFARIAFFLSGLAGLAFEIVWLRYLGLSIGATTLAVATTTAAYMGGLALGSHIGGKVADRLRRPLSVYGAMEAFVALLGLAVPWLCAYVPIVDERFLWDFDSGLGRALVRFFVAVAVLLLPTTAMGTTLPVLARAVTQKVGNVGREVGTLYALNLAGAVAGAALTGFVLVPALGLSGTNLVAVAADLTLGVATLVAGLLLKPVATTEPAPGTADDTLLRPGGRLLVGMLAATGAAAMALQVLWTRAISTALGPSTYAFSSIVCTYLIGLAIGGAIAAAIADRVIAIRFALALTLAATAIAAWFGIAAVDDLPLMLHPVVLDENLTMGGLVRTEFALAALVLLPATIGMGAIFPLTLSAVVGSEKRLGAAVGRAYALNTLGNIAGSFGGVFVLLYFFGVEWGLRLGALIYVVAAAVLLWKSEPSVKPRSRLLAAGVAVAAALLLLATPGWDVARWTLGLYRLSMTRAYFTDTDKVETSRVLFHADGLATTVTVEEEDDTRWIKVNGKIDGSSHGDMPTQVLSGALPVLLHPSPEHVAIIGCGSCVTAGAVLRGNPKDVTLIELEGQVIRAAHLFSEVNHEPWNDPRLTIVEDDGRNFMRRKGAQFDLIISEPSNPWMTGASSLFTLEFFRSAEKRLRPGGMFLQWLQAYELAPERIGSVLKTFQTVFPHLVVFSAHPDSNDFLLLGSKDPIVLPRERLEARFVEMAPELARADLHELDDLFALLLMTDAELADYVKNLPLNTDDNALIEFGAPRDLLAFAEKDPELPVVAELAGKHGEILRRLGAVTSSAEAEVGLARAYLRQGMLGDADTTARRVLEAEAAPAAEVAEQAQEVIDVAALFAQPDDQEAVVDTTIPGPSQEYRKAAQLLATGDTAGALKAFESVPDRIPHDPREKLLYAYLLYRDDRYDLARDYWVGIQHDPAVGAFQPAIAYYLARASYYDGEYARAVLEMKRYRQLRSGSPATAQK